MKERIRQILEWTKLSQQDFATRLGISPASLSSIFTGRTNPTNNHVQAIHRAFPEIDISWLLFGEGMMMVSDGVPENEHGGNEAMTKDNEGGASSEQYAMPSMFSDEDYGVGKEFGNHSFLNIDFKKVDRENINIILEESILFLEEEMKNNE